MVDKADLKVVTGKVRLSYCHLFEPHANNEDQPAKYSTAILISKDDKATLDKIRKAIDAAAELGKSKVFGGKIPKNLKTNLRDGDDDDNIDVEERPEYEGMMFMNISSKVAPGVVDRQLNKIIDQSEVYSGCYAKVSMRAFAYDTSGNKGISFGLNNVQKVEDGEPLGGMTRAEDDFEAMEESDDDVL